MKTRYPILLVHGAGIKNTFFTKAFGDIDRILRIQGHDVYESGCDGFGTVENNAEQIRATIPSISITTRKYIHDIAELMT